MNPVGRFGPPALVVACVLALFLPSLGFPFQWDDRLMLLEEPATADLGNLPRAATAHYLDLLSESPGATPYYRPVSIAVLMVERAVFGTAPRPFRLFHTALHLVAALLLYVAILALLRRDAAVDGRRAGWLAALGATLFALLPYNADVVLLLTDVGNLLALGGMLGALALFERWRGAGRIAALLGGTAVYAGAVFAKEPALVLPGVLIAWQVLDRKPGLGRRAAAAAACSFGVAAAYLAARFALLGTALGVGQGGPSMIASVPAAFGAIVRWTAAPHPMGLVKPLVLPGTWPAIGGGVVLASFLATVAVLARRRVPALSLSLVAFFLLAIPVLPAIANEGALAPRWLYLSGAALAVGVTILLARIGRLAVPALAGLALCAGLLAGVRVAAWRSDFTLWGGEAEAHPELAQNLINLGLAHERAGDQQRALALQLRAIDLAERDGDRAMLLSFAHMNAGRLLAVSPGREEAALRHFRRAAEVSPRDPGPWSGVGRIHARDGAWPRALEAYDRAVKCAPRAIPALIGRAGAQAALGNFTAASTDLDRAAELAAGAEPLTGQIAARRRLVDDLRRKAGGWATPSPGGAEPGSASAGGGR